MPGWKRAVGGKLDKLVTRAVRSVRKAVKWNSPFYGSEGRGWFLSFHCFTKYVKVTFFDGASLKPLPPGRPRRQKHVRYLDIHEDRCISMRSSLLDWMQAGEQTAGVERCGKRRQVADIA